MTNKENKLVLAFTRSQLQADHRFCENLRLTKLKINLGICIFGIHFIYSSFIYLFFKQDSDLPLRHQVIYLRNISFLCPFVRRGKMVYNNKI